MHQRRSCSKEASRPSSGARFVGPKPRYRASHCRPGYRVTDGVSRHLGERGMPGDGIGDDPGRGIGDQPGVRRLGVALPEQDAAQGQIACVERVGVDVDHCCPGPRIIRRRVGGHLAGYLPLPRGQGERSRGATGRRDRHGASHEQQKCRNPWPERIQARSDGATPRHGSPQKEGQAPLLAVTSSRAGRGTSPGRRTPPG